MKKLKNKTGETLIETLVSILIIALSALMIMTASITAARMNRVVRDGQKSCLMTRDDTETGNSKVTIDGKDFGVIKQYKDDIYYFYDKG